MTTATTTNPGPGPLTPAEDPDLEHPSPQSPQPSSPSASYSPSSVPYSEAFENSLMTAILYAESTSTDNPASPTHDMPDADADADTPLIDPTTLPVPLDSPLRIHPSPIPGVRLTHPRGYHTGGPPPLATSSALTSFLSSFLASHPSISTPSELEKAVAERTAELLEEVKERMREREEAVRRNDEVRRKLAELEVQRETEIRVQEKFSKRGRVQ